MGKEKKKRKGHVARVAKTQRARHRKLLKKQRKLARRMAEWTGNGWDKLYPDLFKQKFARA